MHDIAVAARCFLGMNHRIPLLSWCTTWCNQSRDSTWCRCFLGKKRQVLVVSFDQSVVMTEKCTAFLITLLLMLSAVCDHGHCGRHVAHQLQSLTRANVWQV